MLTDRPSGGDEMTARRCHVVLTGTDVRRISDIGLPFAKRLHRPFRDLIAATDLPDDAPVGDRSNAAAGSRYAETAWNDRPSAAAERLDQLLEASTQIVVAGPPSMLAACGGHGQWGDDADGVVVLWLDDDATDPTPEPDTALSEGVPMRRVRLTGDHEELLAAMTDAVAAMECAPDEPADTAPSAVESIIEST